MNTCMYCLRSEPSVGFSAGTRIFPDFMGGRAYLDSGFVCDECQADFRALDAAVGDHPTISVERHFVAARPSKIAVDARFHASLADGSVSAGFPNGKGGVDVPVQLAIRNGRVAAWTDSAEKLKDFLSKVRAAPLGEFWILPCDLFADDDMIITSLARKLVLFANPEHSRAKVEGIFGRYLRDGVLDPEEANLDPIVETPGRARIRALEHEDVKRSLCRAALNLSAYYLGSRTVRDKAFDGIRDFVRTGRNDFNVPYCTLMEPHENLISLNEKVRGFVKADRRTHVAICGGILSIGAQVLATFNLCGNLNFMVRVEDSVLHLLGIRNRVHFVNSESGEEYELGEALN